MKKRLLYLTFGLLLTAAVLLSSTSGFSRTDRQHYETAIAMDSESFPGYHLKDYTVRYFDGDVDYVLKDGVLSKEKPVFRSLVATIEEVNGELQVVVPTAERMKDTLSLLGMGQEGLETSIDHDALQVATLWHEGFHCYQLSHFEGAINRESLPEDLETFIAQEIDAKEELISAFLEAENMLERAINAKELHQAKEFAAEFLSIYHKRRENLTEEARQMESLYEMMEGSAQYIESKIYRAQAGEEAYVEYYMPRESEYLYGISKYYQLGRKICLVLDKLEPDWSTDFDFSMSLSEVLEESIKEER